MIATVHGVGYRFVAPVQVEGEEQTDASEPPVRRPQEIRYCLSPDDVRIAYALSGDGPPLVKAANWLTHLDVEWTSPIWAPLDRRLAPDTGWSATTSAAAACPTGR